MFSDMLPEYQIYHNVKVKILDTYLADFTYDGKSLGLSVKAVHGADDRCRNIGIGGIDGASEFRSCGTLLCPV